MKENKALITVMGKEVEQIEYKGNPVITFRMMDELHERPEGTARKRFNDNKDRFIDGDDYFDVPFSEHSLITAVRISDGGSGNNLEQRNPIKFLTQMGYLMLVKSFTDDLAWKVQRELVKNYFTARSKYSKEHSKILVEQARQMEREIRWLKSKRKLEKSAKKEAILILKGKASIEDYESIPDLQEKIKTILEHDKDFLKNEVPIREQQIFACLDELVDIFLKAPLDFNELYKLDFIPVTDKDGNIEKITFTTTTKTLLKAFNHLITNKKHRFKSTHQLGSFIGQIARDIKISKWEMQPRFSRTSRYDKHLFTKTLDKAE